jgi:hypothetical protein
LSMGLLPFFTLPIACALPLLYVCIIVSMGDIEEGPPGEEWHAGPRRRLHME